MTTMRRAQLLAFGFCTLVCVRAFGQGQSSAGSLPHIEKRGAATQLIIDGKPFLILGGELRNSSASSLAYMKPVWPRLVAMRLNTVLVPVSWELIEPEEGKFDFTIVDGLIDEGRKNGLRLVLLWFGSWKNTYSSYTPAWVKRNVNRFPRVQLGDMRGTERLSPFSDANREADARAFAALMRHIREKDSNAHTVVMVQVENEVGVIPESRDHSAVADKAFAGPVPKDLLHYLQQHHGNLVPDFREIWESSGSKDSGTWEDVFGKGPLTDDLFMAWYFARYVNQVTAAGKAEYALPMFVNAALVRPNYQPGQYNSGGPLPHSMDVWRAGAPDVDFFAPDIYFDNFAEWCRKYHRGGNPLFVPEAISGPTGAANVFYAIGAQQAIGFSPFAIDDLQEKRDDAGATLDASYAVLSRLMPLILQAQTTNQIVAMVLEGESQRAGRVSLGNYTMNIVRTPATGRTTAERGAVMFLQAGPDEYIVAGAGNLQITFVASPPGLPYAGIASIDEEVLADGQWTKGRRLNGDEDAQGQLLRLDSQPKIYRVVLYRYR